MSQFYDSHLGSSLKGSKLPTLRKGGHSSIVSDRSSESSATKYLDAVQYMSPNSDETEKKAPGSVQGSEKAKGVVSGEPNFHLSVLMT